MDGYSKIGFLPWIPDWAAGLVIFVFLAASILTALWGIVGILRWVLRTEILSIYNSYDDADHEYCFRHPCKVCTEKVMLSYEKQLRQGARLIGRPGLTRKVK